MSLNWKALAPHRPLDPGEAGYVVSPSGFAERIARLVTTGTSTVLVGGPVGVGKSTELARITALLQGPRAACLVQLDRHENIRRLTADQLLLRLAGQLVEYAIESLRLNVSSSLAEPLLASGVLSPRIAPAIAPGFLAFQSSPEALVNAALEEVTRRSRQGRVTLLIDGLEKMPESTQAHEILAALGGLDESVDLVIVVPWFVAFGSSEDAIRPGALFAPVPAPPVEGPEGRTGRQFLADVLTTRLGLPREVLGAAEKQRLRRRVGTCGPGEPWSSKPRDGAAVCRGHSCN
ncbi:AAA family ATPase [Nannocystis pusilla]|uniref:AAA family ATPase n=1 Tax=Nannocystis pusilla TaxID=889268 RepID=A0A9X3IVE6_9BACT|nr:AAA family ATPase [Nannocystis pusilla]MCY1005306.1 AAA family ATPase [Nannocystis pusilla]